MNEQRMKQLLPFCPSKSVASRQAAQTEHMSDETFRELLAFRLIERTERDVEKMIVDVVTNEHRHFVVVAGISVEGDPNNLDAWTRKVLEVLAAKGCIEMASAGFIFSATSEDLVEFYDRRKRALAMAPKGKAVCYG